jgi:hypothetical protein
MSRLPVKKKSNVSWALPNLLSVLQRAARTVARKYPGSVLDIGELSRKEGGRIKSHLSHQSGRDADVGFYLTDLDGSPLRAPRFLRCDGHGEGKDDPTIRFDDRRNWEFVRALLEDPNEEVRQIFIYAPLRARLLAYAAKVKAPHKLRMKAAAAMMQPMNALPHDDHFHVRISCPLDMVERGCADLPMWRAPGSPDEFGPEYLARGPRFRYGTPFTGVPLENWGGMAKLWSTERGVCDAGSLTCGDNSATTCQELDDPELLASFPRALFDVPAPATPSNVAPGQEGPRDDVPGATEVRTAFGSLPPPLPVDAFADEGPAVTLTEATEPSRVATGSDGAHIPGATETSRTATAIETPNPAPAASATYCSVEEPNACESPIAALTPSNDPSSYAAILE